MKGALAMPVVTVPGRDDLGAGRRLAGAGLVRDERRPPSLDELRADPMRARELTADEAKALLIALAPVQQALLLAALTTPAPAAVAPEPTGRLLTVEQAAELTQMSRRALYNAARRVEWKPFVFRINARTLRFREAGLRRWITSQARRNG